MCVSTTSALELKFKPSFLELHAEGMVQRVMPGELVEVPLGNESSLEIELSMTPPRKIEISSQGESEFVVFGAKSRLGDGGKMVASMSAQTKKLDISWTKGEMSTPPGNFDKPAVVTFFTQEEPEFLQPLEFAGVRPFGYTEVLEGRRPPEDGEIPYFPPPPQNMDYAPPQSRPSSPSLSSQGWVNYGEEQNVPPPLTLPPPLPPRREQPSQIVFLEPSEAEEENVEKEEKPTSLPEELLPDTKTDTTPSSKDTPSEDTPSKDTPSKDTPSEDTQKTVPEEKKIDKTPLAPSDEKRRTKPTIYQMVMDQDKKQRELMEKLEAVVQQVKNAKESEPENKESPLPRVLETLTFLGEAAPSFFAPLPTLANNNSPESALFPYSSYVPPRDTPRDTVVAPIVGSGSSDAPSSEESDNWDQSGTVTASEFEVEIISSE